MIMSDENERKIAAVNWIQFTLKNALVISI